MQKAVIGGAAGHGFHGNSGLVGDFSRLVSGFINGK